MSGNELKKILLKQGITITDLAKKLGVTQPSVRQALQVQDIKTGFLEKLCDILGVPMSFFYKEERNDFLYRDYEDAKRYRVMYDEERCKCIELSSRLEGLKTAYDKLLDRVDNLVVERIKQ